MALRLKAVHLYTQDLGAMLYKFPGIGPEPEPYLTSAIPVKLDVPSPAPLDAILLAFKYIEALGDKTPDAVYAALWQLIATRDEAFYYRPDRWAGLTPNDVRRPFFARGGAERTQPAIAAFRKWAKAYVAGLPATVFSAAGLSSEQQDGSRIVEPLQGGRVVPADNYAKLLTQNHLQADQLISIDNANFPVVNIGGAAVPVLFAMPNRWSLYTFKIPKQKYQPPSELISTFKLGAARLASDADIYGRTVLVIDLTPLSTKVLAGNKILAGQTYGGIPPLNGLAFTSSSPQAEKPVSGSTFALDPALLDVLAAKAVGEKLSRQALVYMIERRWLAETKGTAPGGRFFALGKRQPTPEEAATLAPSFINWASQHAPAFPVKATISGSVEVANGQKTAPWRAIPCLLMNSDTSLFDDNGHDWSRFNFAELSRLQKVGGSWSPDAEEQLAAAEAFASASRSFYVGGGPSGPCAIRLSLLFPDPAVFAIRIKHALPTPSISELSGKQRLDLEATLDLTSIALSQSPPSIAGLLPPDVLKSIPASPQSSSQTPPGREYVTFDTSFIEARWRDPNGRQVARLGPEHGDDLDSLVKRYQLRVAKLAADLGAPSGPYGPDLVGIRLGMSFEEAEAAIRKHMQVAHVYEGMRVTDPKARAGYPKPFTSGKLFVSGDGHEMIALIDEPPAAPGKVLAAWRRVLIEPGTIPPEETLAALKAKYGLPSGVPTMHTGSPMSWYEPRGAHCAGYYGYGGTIALSDFWTDNGAPFLLPGASPYQQANAPMIPDPLLDPLGQQNQQARQCGPVLTAYYLHATHIYMQAAQPSIGLDTIDTMISDFDAYRDAYIHSRKMLQSTPPAPMSLFPGPYGPDVVGVRLGMRFDEARSVIGQHMKVGGEFQIDGAREPIGAAELPGSGLLFVSAGNDEVIAVFDAPHPGEGHVAAVWRRVYSPQAVDLALVTRRATEKYGAPICSGRERPSARLGLRPRDGLRRLGLTDLRGADTGRGARGRRGGDRFPFPRNQRRDDPYETGDQPSRAAVWRCQRLRERLRSPPECRFPARPGRSADERDGDYAH